MAKDSVICDLHPRRSFLHVAFLEAHLRGITGPGAPHSFSFERRGDLPGRLPNDELMSDFQGLEHSLFQSTSVSCP